MTPPKHLDEPARQKWAEILPILQARGDVDQAAADALACYASAWSRWTAAETKVAELGPVVKSPAGSAVANPFLAVAKEAQRQMRQWADVLRLLPRSPAKTTEAAPPTTSVLDRLLKRGAN